MSSGWTLFSLVVGLMAGFAAMRLASGLLSRFGVALNHEVETGRVGDQPVIEHRETGVSQVVGIDAFFAGLFGGVFGLVYFITWVRGV